MTRRTSPALLPCLAAATVTTAAAPVVRMGLVALDIVDVPNERSSHVSPIPRGGGLACAAGVVAATLLHPSGMTRRDVVCVGALVLTGIVDDRRGLPPLARLAVQVTCGAWVGSSTAWETLRGALVVPIAVNVVNFMDGVNGISALTALAWGTHAALVSPGHSQGSALAGAGLGFLPWNAPKARLFLGDSGSYLIGSLVGTSITSAGLATATRLALPLTPYLMDAALTMARRVAAGRDVLASHREHAYQRLVHERGLTHLQVAGTHALLVGVIGWVSRHSRTSTACRVAVGLGTAWACSPSIARQTLRVRAKVTAWSGHRESMG